MTVRIPLSLSASLAAILLIAAPAGAQAALFQVADAGSSHQHFDGDDQQIPATTRTTTTRAG